MEEYASHVEDMARALGDKDVDKEKLAKELYEYIHRYKVDVDTGKRAIVNKYGGDVNLLTRSGRIVDKLSELQPNERSVDVVGRIMSVNEKEVQTDGVKKKVFYGIINDGTKSVQYTSWQEPFPYSKGDIIRVKNAYTKEWKGEPQLVFGNFAVISRASADDLPSIKPGEGEEVKVRDMRAGIAGIVCTVRILDISRKDVKTGDGNLKTILYGRCGDETGTISFTCWYDAGISEDDVIRVSGAYVKGWRGIPQLIFDERAHIENMPNDVLPGREEIASAVITTINEIEERGGGENIRIRGVCVGIKSGTGLIYRCGECGRVLRAGKCGDHGEVENSRADLRIKTVVDDGTGSLMAVIGREITEKILGKTVDECIRKMTSVGSAEGIKDEIIKKLLGRPFDFTGNVTKDDFGLMMVVWEMKEPHYDINEEVRKIIEGMEGF